MPKIKSHKGLAKRIKKTKSGKLLRRSAFISHNLSKKRSTRKRRHQREFTLSKGNKKNVKKLIPY